MSGAFCVTVFRTRACIPCAVKAAITFYRYRAISGTLRAANSRPYDQACLIAKAPTFRLRLLMLALSIFPASHPASIVDADELNFCVRDGNRWTLIAINTNYVDGFCPSFICQSAPRSNSLWIIAPFSLFVNSCFVSLTKSKPSEAGLIWKRRATIQAEYRAHVIWSIVSCARSW